VRVFGVGWHWHGVQALAAMRPAHGTAGKRGQRVEERLNASVAAPRACAVFSKPRVLVKIGE